MRIAVITSIFLASVGVLGLPLVERQDSDGSLWERDDSSSLDARDEAFVDISERDAINDFELDARDIEDDLLQSRDIFDIASPLEARAKPKGPKPPPTTKPKPPKTPATNPKKIANKDARKTNKAEKKAEVKAAGPSKAAQDKVRNTQKANAQKEHDIKTKAGKEHKATTGLPGRKENFNVPAGGGKPEINLNGKDVRQGVYNAHEAHQRKVAANGPKMQAPAFGEKFKNKDHQVAKPGTTKPIDGMTGPGKEHTYSTSTDPAQRKTDHSNNPVRLITQPKPAGGHEFKGVLAHDQSRLPGTPGVNDHFQVKGTP